MSSNKFKFPVPEGFRWDHTNNGYFNISRTQRWDDQTNVFYDKDDNVIPAVGKAVDSASDARVVNNGGNTMRSTYRVLDDAEKAHMHAIKSKGEELLQVIQNLGTSRELSLAATNLEQAVMWAVKHITK